MESSKPKYVEKEHKKVDVWRYKKYMCKVKIIKIQTGKRIILLNTDQAKEHDIYTGYRTEVKFNSHSLVAIVDTTSDLVKHGQVGIYNELAEDLGLKEGAVVEIVHLNRPASLEYIKKKMDGEALTATQIDTIVDDIMDGKLGEAETAAWVSAAYINGFSDPEIVALANATVRSGDHLDLGKKGVVDKHCSGGVAGNRTTMLIVPIIACTDLYIPKTSSRAITSASVTSDTEVLIVDDELAKIKNISEFVDPYFSEKDNGYVELKDSKIKVPAFDRNLKVKYRPLTGVFRHRVEEDVIEITLEQNRKVKVTKHHSVFVLRKGSVISLPTSQISVGDYLAVPRSLDSTPEVKELNLVEEFKKISSPEIQDKILVKGISKKSKNASPRNWLRWKRGVASISILDKQEIGNGHTIKWAKGRHAGIPAILNITEPLLKLLGYFVAEGVFQEHGLSFHIGRHEKELAADIVRCSKEALGITAIIDNRKDRDSETVIRIEGKIVSLLFEKILRTGKGAANKRIPDIVFNVNNELKQKFLDAYLEGDGCERKGHAGFEAVTVSKELASQLQYLLSFFGKSASTYTQKPKTRDFGKYVSKCRESYRIYIPKSNKLSSVKILPVEEIGLRDVSIKLDSPTNDFKMSYMIRNQTSMSIATLQKQIPQLSELESICSLVESDLSFLKVKGMELVDYKGEYVYDLCVEGYENFVGGFGPIFLHNSGTADTAEVLAQVNFSIDELKDIVLKSHGAMVWGGGIKLAPVDDRLIRIRNPLSLDPEGMLLASILGKKKSVGAKYVIIDIPVGRGAKFNDMDKAQNLAKHFINIGKQMGMEVEALITDGAEPIGNGIGPGLECRDVLEVLEGKGPEDLRHKACTMAGKLLELCGKTPKGKGYLVAENLLNNGKALKKFREIIELQGGNGKVKSSDVPIGHYTYDAKADTDGQIFHIDNKVISKIARIAGAPMDKGAGVFLYRLRGDHVKKGDKIFTIHAESETKLDFAIKALTDLEPTEMRRMVLGVVDE